MTRPTEFPEWAEDDVVFPDGTPNKEQPTPNLTSQGFAPDSFPTPQEFNWWMNKVNEWLTYLDAQVAAPSQLPVGFVVEIHGNAANPNTLLGYGSWSPYAQGRVTIGAGSATDINGELQTFNGGATGGEYKHKLTLPELPQHSHTGGIQGPGGGSQYTIEAFSGAAPASDNYRPFNTGSSGGDQAHNNIQPYIVVYKWVRTA